MSDPRRLVEEDGTEFERRLLLSAQSEQPPPDMVRRMEGALGFAAVAAVGTSVAAATSAVAAAPKVVVEAGSAASAGAVRAAAASSPVGAATLPLVLKAVGLGSLVVAGAVVVNLWMSRPARPPAMGPGAPVAPLIVRAPEPMPAPAATAAPPAPAAAAVAAPSRAPAIAATSDTRAAHTGAGALRGEITLIDGARAALAGGSPARAIQILAQHDARYPRGVLVPEAQALRIEALAASGQRRRARSLARAFLAAHPSSPLAERIARVRDGEENR